MNKQYITALAAVLIAGSAAAQNSVGPLPSLKVPYDASAVRHNAPSQAKGAVIWTNDFSIPADWVITHDPNGFVVDWEIGIGIESGGPFGTPAILSTSAANGYAMLNSDGGNNDPPMGYEQSFLTTAQSIDLSAYPNVVLQFETQYRRFTNEQTYIAVSTDGVSWPVPPSDTATVGLPLGLYPVWAAGELVQSVSPGNPTTKRINISSSAGSQGTVWIRFYWYGIYGYAWYVDDVQLEEQPQYDVVMNSGFVSHTGTGDEFGRIPAGQYAGTMNVGGAYTNPGVQDQTNVVVSASGPFTASTSSPLLVTDETLLMDETVTATLTQQVHTATFNVTSDQIAQDAFPANNTYLRNFEITEFEYSLDGIGNHPAGYELLTSTGTSSFTNNADNLFLFTRYFIDQPLDVYALEVVFANGTVAGGIIVGSLHDTLEVQQDNVLSPLVASAEHDVTAADVTAGSAIIVFDSPYTLPAGVYFAGAELLSNSNANDIRVLDDITVPQPGNASLISLADDGLTYGNGNAFAIRLISDPSIGIRESNELAGISLYPNPNEGIFTINAAEAGSYLVDVTNVLGATVQSTRFNNTLKMDLTGLAKGVYTVRVSNDAASTVQKVTIR